VKRLLARAAWLALPLFALCEVAAHAATRARVPERADWVDAARFVRSQLAPGDLITSAPGWTDPLLREVLGDRIDLAMAGRSDDAGYERVWSLSIRGARAAELQRRVPDVQRSFGRVRVERAALGASPVLFDFTRALRSAEVASGPRERERSCRLGELAPGRGGGLGLGALAPRERFECGRGAWVAAVVLEDLALQPRYCVRQPPVERGPLRVRFRDVPLGQRLVFYGGLYYEDERMRRGADVHARVLASVGDATRELLKMTHRDGEGWKRLELATGGGRADVTVEVTSSSTNKRTFCWAASTRTGMPGKGR
jgi:hypothetical protein